LSVKNVVIIGGGPGGYIGAIRAAQLGAAVTLVEKDDSLGGTCLNRGCMPTKVLLHTVGLKEEVIRADQLGLEATDVGINLVKLRRRKARVVRQLTAGVKMLLKANGVEVITGEASFTGPKEIQVTLTDGREKTLQGDVIIIATGSTEVTLPIPGSELPGIWNSDKALEVEEIPEKLLIVGGGVIGTEFAGIYRGLGSEVTVVEMMPRLLPPVDAEIADLLAHEFSRKKIKVRTGSRVSQIVKAPGGYRVSVATATGNEVIEVDRVLIAVGRKAYTAGLGLEKTRVKVEGGRILVDPYLETAEAGVYAIGDVNGQAMLAHVASAQGVRAVENALGEKKKMELRVVPNCIFTQPEVAAVGLTESEAREKGEVIVGRFPFSASGKALVQNARSGLVKVIARRQDEKILGLHIIGPGATELILEGGLGLRLGANLDDIYTTIHAHPTLGEAVFEAALDAKGRAFHVPPQ
jgi:dihydrolipoamide dehydrogenase